MNATLVSILLWPSLPPISINLLNCRSSLLNTFDVGRDSDWLRDGRSGDRISVETLFFRTRPDRRWGPPSLLYSG